MSNRPIVQYVTSIVSNYLNGTIHKLYVNYVRPNERSDRIDMVGSQLAQPLQPPLPPRDEVGDRIRTGESVWRGHLPVSSIMYGSVSCSGLPDFVQIPILVDKWDTNSYW